jgi:hypothetical protein
MKRPEFITNEDIMRWSENIDNDDTLPQAVKESPVIREVCYAGLWISEELEKLGCSKELISKVQYTGGQLSFGRDPWEVHQRLLTGYKTLGLQFEDDLFRAN